MKKIGSFFLTVLPFTTGLILSLTALSFLVNFTDSARFSNMDEEDFLAFVFLCILGIPMLVSGIRKLSN